MCRMLIASGDLDVNSIVNGAIAMARDCISIHELNKEKGLGSWKHDDGWGIAYLNQQGKWVIKKSTIAIYDDPQVEHFKRIKTKLLVLHMRKKAGSETSINNTHPFIINNVTARYGELNGPVIFCHNGFINEEIKYDSEFTVTGTTDSEKLFYSLLTDLKKEQLEKSIQNNFSRYHQLTGTNIILSSLQKAVIAIRETKFPKYYTMMLGKKQGTVIISSDKLALPEVTWTAVQPGKIITLNHKTLDISISKQKD